ncbi:MraY family glycosyltransferase [Homoserinimonas sp. OAct 916]|uniref:MraY family glycosyltransferase n=1 Tax=Homoserinimonas sp. OAct 916 TaxID=2211450 RepID=UPI000DBE3E28|nr:MraY family glycosyltransferase [Homoserinimonas sp. OAct 916]
MLLFLLMALIAAIVTLALGFVIWRVALKHQWYPMIRDRDVHTRPTPRLGGIAMFIGILAAFAVASQIGYFRLVFDDPVPILAILGASGLIVAMGVIDDIWDLDWMTKLAGQFIAAGLVAWKGVTILSIPIGEIALFSSNVSLILTIFAIVLVMNAINFIDGLDGLVVGVALIANGVFFLYTYLLWRDISPSNYFNLASLIAVVLVGVCVGILPLNWHPARMFIGDAGALLIGLLMATGAIAVTGSIDPANISRSQFLPAFIPILLPFAVLIVPVVDFSMAVIRRLRAGKSPFSADRKHLHHRLLDMGHSHFHAVLIFYAWTAVFSIGCLLFYLVQPNWIAVVFLAVGLLACLAITLAPLGRRDRARRLQPAPSTPKESS